MKSLKQRYVMQYVWRVAILLLSVPPLVGSIGCSSPDLSGPTSVDVSQLVWTLSLNAHAITMSTAAPYDTLQLTAVPRTTTGTPLAGAPLPTFRTQDSSLRVSPTGLLTARKARSGVLVIAEVLYKGIRVADTAVVNITTVTNPAAFEQLRLRVPLGDSTKIAAPNDYSGFYYDDFKTLEISALDGTQTQIPNSLVALRISDPLQAAFEPTGVRVFSDPSVIAKILLSSRIGVPFTVYASATVYGVTKEDSLQILVTDELFSTYYFTKQILPGSTTPVVTLPYQATRVIGVGGWVWWYNATTSADLLDVVFDDPTAASPDQFNFNSGGGNIAPFAGGSEFSPLIIRSRQFLQAGTFHWQSPRTGLSGTVVVRGGSQ